MKKFKCSCGHDKFKLAMLETICHESGNRKTFSSSVPEMFLKRSGEISYTATCSGCHCYWFAYESVDELQKKMIEDGALS